jgi:hypothetical protein
MAMYLLEAGGAEQFRARVNSDGEFARIARDMALNLVIDVSGDSRLVEIHAGSVRAVRRFAPLSEPVDITIRGTNDFWSSLLSPIPPPRFQNLYAAVRAGTCEVIGNGELYAACFAAISRMTVIMRELQNSHTPR